MSSDLAQPSAASGVIARPNLAGPIAILLCTYNGARFLPLQLKSYEAQDFANWRLYVSDDGSQDATLAMLAEFQNKHGASRVHVRQGPRQGFVANFLSLICDPAIMADYYALSDQDDVWASDKLSRARRQLDAAPADRPVLYCSRTRLIDRQGVELGLSTYYRKTPQFRNALAQSLASGNTMVFNEDMRWLLMRAGPDVRVAAHDWWAYMVITAVGGAILYDSMPTVSYRIHGRNVIGSNESALAKVLRARLLWEGRYKSWAEMNVAALERIENLMTDENRETFDLFRGARKRSMIPRVCGLVQSSIHRQSLLGNLGLLAAAVTGRI
jgi:glycosyltransferase involved in cell wall biosynthesis